MIPIMENMRHNSSDVLPCNLSRGTFSSTYVRVIVALQDNNYEELRKINNNFLKTDVLSGFGGNQISFVIK